MRLTVAFVALLLVPTASATSGHLGDVTARSLRLDGLVTIDAGLHAMLATDAASLAFHLTAAAAHIEVDIVNATSLPFGAVDAQPSVMRRDIGGSDGTLTRVGAAPLLAIMQAPGEGPPALHIASGSGVATPDSGQISAPVRVPLTGRTAPDVDVTGGVAWTFADGPEATITGTFLLVLYDVDLAIDSAEGPSSLVTGLHTDPVTPQAGPTSVLVGHSSNRQAYLLVHDATLQLGGDLLAQAAWHTASAAAAVMGRVGLHEFDGRMSDGRQDQPVAGAEGRLDGNLQATVRTLDAGRLALSLDGNGNPGIGPLAWVAAPQGATMPWATWPALTMLVAGAGAVPMRRRLQGRGMVRLEEAHASGDDQQVLVLSKGLVRSGPFRQDAAILRVEALTRVGRTDEAVALLGRPRVWGRGEAVRLYLCAFVSLAQRRHADARTHLAASLALDPALRSQVLADPAFRSLWDSVEGYA